MKRPRPLATTLLLLAPLVAVAVLALPRPPEEKGAPGVAIEHGDDGVMMSLIRRFTREESVSIRIDEERRMRVDRRGESSGGTETGPRAGSSTDVAADAWSGDWIVLDHRWLGTGGRAGDRAMSYVGADMGADAHVTVTPPFVVLTRGEESILVKMEGNRRVSVDEPMPDWVRSDPDSGLLLARFDGFGDAAIGGGAVHLQRRFFLW